jgi:hypothetical protein
MKIPDGWVLVPREPTEAMREAGVETGLPPRAMYAAMLAAAPPPPGDPEVDAGKAMDGYAGAVMRLVDRCDYREVQAWMRAEIIRGTDQAHIINAAAAAVEGIAIQCAGLVTRSQMREFARRILMKAAEVLEQDIQAMIDAKKADTVLANRIKIVVPGGGIGT